MNWYRSNTSSVSTKIDPLVTNKKSSTAKRNMNLKQFCEIECWFSWGPPNIMSSMAIIALVSYLLRHWTKLIMYRLVSPNQIIFQSKLSLRIHVKHVYFICFISIKSRFGSSTFTIRKNLLDKVKFMFQINSIRRQLEICFSVVNKIGYCRSRRRRANKVKIYCHQTWLMYLVEVVETKTPLW